MPRSLMISIALVGLILSLTSIFFLDYTLASKVLVLGIDQVSFWNYVTQMGDSKWMALLLIALWIGGFSFGRISPENPLWSRLRKKSLLILAAVAGTGILVMILKVIVGRARPYMGDIGFFPFTFGSEYASWPSGHATTAFAFAVAVGLAIPVLRGPLFILAILVAYSRMALGVHYLGDVIMGATIGSLGAVLIYRALAPKLGIKT
ncbi:MAG: phosphatase PAP2 family protein [Rhodobacteraceae bacterium]|nr:phosphatase PAP2 family protein [Paracoccaceae bacterium]